MTQTQPTVERRGDRIVIRLGDAEVSVPAEGASLLVDGIIVASEQNESTEPTQ